MPSLWSKWAQHIHSTSCPPFDELLTKQACQAKLDAVQAETAALRAEVGKAWACNMQDPSWDAELRAKPLFPSPAGLFESNEVKRLRQVLPAELLAPINESGLSLKGQLDMAHKLEKNISAYATELLRHTGPAGVHKARLNEAFEAAKKDGYPPKRKSDDTSQFSLGMIPTGSINTITTKRRYFRALAWNLENFTRDRRPRGSAPIDSVRNQARIAIVTELMRAFDVDLLLVMETGYDVGPAMTAIASRLEKAVSAPHGVHPLVSPPTGSLPSVKRRYAKVKLKRRTGTRALALRTLFDVYHVSSNDADLPVTKAQVAAGWALLREASSEAKSALGELLEGDAVIESKSGRRFPHPDLIAVLVGKLGDLFFKAQMKSKLPDLAYQLGHDMIELTKLFSQHGVLDLKSKDLRAFYDDLCDGAQLLRELAVEANDIQDGTTRTLVVGYTQGLELLLLFLLQSLAGGIPGDESGLVFASSHAEGSAVTLAAYLTSVSSSLDLQSIDQVLGPLDGKLDNDIVLDALQRLGIVDRHIETYGMVYRPPCKNALGRLFDIGVKAHGFKGEIDERASKYPNIVRGQLSGGGFSIQQSGGLLNWRSALQITVPVSETLSVPIALFHTRYSGTKEIAAEYEKEGLTKAEADVRARAETLTLMAKALLPGHSRFGMPLIVGDFNIPDEYLDPTDKTTKGANRKQGIRKALTEGMAACGYLRHTTDAKIGVGHPRTTLKSFGSLGLGELDGSQPYDGVYEPFDFAQRCAVVQSGVVKLPAIITAEAMKETILGKVVASKDVIDLSSGESSDAPSENGPEDDNESTSSGKEAKMLVIDAVAQEVARVYAACARRLLRRIKT